MKTRLAAALLMAAAVLADPSIARGEAPAQASVAVLLRDQQALKAWVLRHSLDVSAASARVDQAEADYGASSVLLPNPVVDFTLSDINVGRSNPGGLRFNDTSIYSVGISQTVELGKRGPRMDAARLRVASSREEYHGNLGQRVADSRAALARLVYLKARQQALDEMVISAHRVLDLEQTRLQHGDLSGSDVQRLTLDTITLEADVAKNQADLQGAMAQCRAVLFAPCGLDASDITLLDAAPPLPAALAAYQASIERRPDIEAARLESQASHVDAKLARRRAIPDPTVRFGYTRDNLTVSGDQRDTIGFTVSIPIPLFDHGQHDAAKATARARELELTRNALVVTAQADVESLLRRKAYVETTLATLASTALPRAASVLESTTKAFSQGQISMTELLLARRSHVALVLAIMDLRFETFSVRNDVRRALGLDTEQNER